MSVPEWVQDAVFYQIFPDRFARSRENIRPYLQPWGSTPTLTGFQGGDLRGVMERFDYLLDLGINAIYFNPIFQSSSTHRYNADDYYRIDDRLGSLADFRALLNLAHRNGVRVILDGVFNHCGRGFFAFHDLVENGADSVYRDWFHVRRFPLRAYEPGKARNYVGWWGYKSLPKFNTDTPQVRRYLLDVARFWIDEGIDGWRLDVPNEIDDDGFWAEFRQTVRAGNPQAYLLGEIWEPLPRWVGDEHFDGLMNYPLRTALLDLLTGRCTAQVFGQRAEALLRLYPQENVRAMYVLLGSHDTERIWTMAEGDLRKLQLAFAFQFAYPGAPAVYYGDEVGLAGGRDPQCRAAFPWDGPWNEALRAWVKHLIALRHVSPSLRRGDYRGLDCASSNCYAFLRSVEEETVLVVLNASEQAQTLTLAAPEQWPEGYQPMDMLGGRAGRVMDGQVTLTLAAWGVVYLA
ncbi:MAG: alpha-glucosidase C-terminal domain-containing protein [Longilinea sp.]|nr:alpha-glucosidase C-terminal domain-containing protein [Longilinea sp.]MCA1954561.1 glycoside hydrolase family 13 protein [Anaerolinea sp.]